MNKYSNVRDYTMNQKGPISGMAYRKRCSACNQPREMRGGSLFSKLRLWRCVDCTQKAKEKNP